MFRKGGWCITDLECFGTLKVIYSNLLISEMRKLRLREVKYVALGNIVIGRARN